MYELEQVRIFDTTLRDGDQSPGISFDMDEKLEIAEQLGLLGVDIIEAGFPQASQSDFEAVQAIAELYGQSGPIVCGLARTALADIDRCWEAIQPAEKSRIHVFIATSENHMQNKLKMTREQVMKETARGVSHARQYTDDVEFSPEDASRSDFDFMREVLQVAVDAGATTLNIPDTVGHILPDEYALQLSDIRNTVTGEYTISTHCHDDLGLSVSNSLAGIKAGARQVEVAVNGIGERAGNAALEPIIAAIDHRADYFQVRTDIDRTRLRETSKLVARLSGFPVAPNTAVVGDNAFAHEAGIHQHGMLEDSTTYEILDPKAYGQKSSIVIGELSGAHGVLSRLDVLGIRVNNVPEIARACKETVSEQVRSEITDVEIEEIAIEYSTNGRIENPIEIINFNTESSDDASAASLTLTNGAQVHCVKSSNGGEIGAGIKAIQTLYPGYKFELDGIRATEKQAGETSTGGSLIEVEIPTGEIITSYAEDKNVVKATLKAFVRAINCGERIIKRKQEQGY